MKRKVKSQNNDNGAVHTGKAKIRIHTTANGSQITLLPVSPFLMKEIEIGLEDEIGRPVKPTYITKIGEGETAVVQEVEHDETTITTEEELVDWKAYNEHLKKWNELLQARMVEAIVLEGIEFDMPEDNSWIARQKRLGIKVPDDQIDREIHYFRTKVIGDPEDLLEVMMLAMAGSEVDADTKKAANALFRREVQKAISNA